MEDARKNSVLIVDDVNMNIMALNNILSPDYIVYAVKNGKNAIIAAGRYHPDIILLDILMPEMDGYEVIAALKSADDTKDIPVIFITGLSDPCDEEKGLALGAADYISKPFSSAVVKMRVQSQIRIINQTRLMLENEEAVKNCRAWSDAVSEKNREMRAPMDAIIGMTAKAIDAANSGTQDELLKKITDESCRLQKLIEEVLEMPRANGEGSEAGKVEQ